MSIHTKILAIMTDVEEVVKEGRNTAQNYKYVQEAALLETLRSALIKHQVTVIPSITGYDIRQFQTKDGQFAQPLVIVNMEYRITDADSGEFLLIPYVGTGADTGDKGLYKAITGANKYLLLKTFQIPTTDDPENDTPAAAPSRPAARPTVAKSTETPVKKPFYPKPV